MKTQVEQNNQGNETVLNKIGRIFNLIILFSHLHVNALVEGFEF